MTSNIYYAVGDWIRGEFDPSRWYYVNLMAWVAHQWLRFNNRQRSWIIYLSLIMISNYSALRTTGHWFGAFSYFSLRKSPYIWHFHPHSAIIRPFSSVLGSIWRHFAMKSLTFSAKSMCALRKAEVICPSFRWIRCYAVPSKYKCKHQSKCESLLGILYSNRLHLTLYATISSLFDRLARIMSCCIFFQMFFGAVNLAMTLYNMFLV